jgi:hypothetical protein
MLVREPGRVMARFISETPFPCLKELPNCVFLLKRKSLQLPT